MSFALRTRYDAFKLEKEVMLSEVIKLKEKLASQQNMKFTIILADLRRTCIADVCVLKDNCRRVRNEQVGCILGLIFSPIVARRKRGFEEG